MITNTIAAASPHCASFRIIHWSTEFAIGGETSPRGGQGRDRTGDLPLFRRTLIPTELPGRKAPKPQTQVPRQTLATLTGLEPATSAVTGRRANQLRHRALLFVPCDSIVRGAARTPYGIRTRATALKGRRPRPLDEGGQPNLSGVLTTL